MNSGEFWDDIINRKYSSNSRFYDLKISEIVKYTSNDEVYKYYGYDIDYNNIVNVVCIKGTSHIMFGIGYGFCDYEAEKLTYIQLNTEKELTDKFVHNILRNHFNWRIKHFGTICD